MMYANPLLVVKAMSSLPKVNLITVPGVISEKGKLIIELDFSMLQPCLRTTPFG